MNGYSIQYVIFFLMLSVQSFAAPQKTSFVYYSEDISLRYEQSIIPRIKIKTNDASIQHFYNELEQLPFRPLLFQLMRYRRDLDLNSYLYYDLIHKAVASIYSEKSKNYRTLVEWYLLAKSDFDVRLTHLAQHIYLYAYTEDPIYNIPIIQLNKKEFINLTDVNTTQTSNKQHSFFVVDFVPNEAGQPLSFQLDELPKLKKTPVEKKLVFAHRNELHRLTITIDETIIDLMRNYPLTNPSYYIETPLSKSLKESLLPKLRELLEHKEPQEAIQFLLSLTRTAFEYQTDMDNFGKNKPMIPDEVLFYSHSDCEDRSALFYTLVKELVDIPVIIVDYPEHLTVGVSLPENIGKPLFHNNRAYTICDPTGPSNTDAIGIYPNGYEQLPYKVALSFK